MRAPSGGINPGNGSGHSAFLEVHVKVLGLNLHNGHGCTSVDGGELLDPCMEAF
jgi:hypothetical protein